METDRVEVKATGGDGGYRPHCLCSLLDTLVAVRMDLRAGVNGNGVLPGPLIDHLTQVDKDIEVAITLLKTNIRDQGLLVL